jgi:signal peptidase I
VKPTTFVRDNIEAFAVAIAMALVIRHFCIEAFRIPTGSMMPTLLGDAGPHGERRHGDRILVDKYVWMRRAPRRFEVAVFQYPLNRNKNYIKRIAGVGPEWLRIADGDLWRSADEGKTWTIARKPEGVREQLLFPYYPAPVGDPGAFHDEVCWKPGKGWDVSEREGRFSVDAGDAATHLVFNKRVLPYPYADGEYNYSEPYVGDMRIAFEARVERAGELVVQIEEHGRAFRLVLGDQRSRIEVDGKTTEIDVKLAAGETYDVSLANIDDMVYVDVNGDTVEVDYTGAEPADPSVGTWMRHTLRLEATGCKAELTGLRVARDVYYSGPDAQPERVWKIPDGHYFMLGDNTESSKDSREWKVAEARRADGEVIRWEPHTGDGTRNPLGGKPNEDPAYEVYVQADVEGHTRRFAVGDIESWKSSVRRPFVPRGHLIGRAFAVFWPVYLPPLSKHPTRVKLIR